MPYAKDYRNSSILKDDQVKMLIQSMMNTPTGTVEVTFDSVADLKRMRQRLYYVLRSLEQTTDYKISALDLTLVITKTQPVAMQVQMKEDK